MIILMGEKEDLQIGLVAKQLSNKNINFKILDSRQFPLEIQLSYKPANQAMQLRLGEKVFVTDDVKGLYWRNFQVAPVKQNPSNWIATRDSQSLLKSFLKKLGRKAINSWDAIEFHQEKPRQLEAVFQAGVTIPSTWVGNDKDGLRNFVAKTGRCIFKPVVGGDHTGFVTEKHLEEEHLTKALGQAPVTVQQCIDGTNIRTYVIGDRQFSAEIASDSLDFREDTNARLIPMTPPTEIQQQAQTIRKVLGLAWTAIDWRRDEQGRYFYLEANPSPMFYHFEKLTGHPVSLALSELLQNPGKD
ncbi:hypothetical protein PVT67_01200 [Gallaecimonas kandeliae]|uniref:ATP-grasp domain-containing protein n=1 Tax=Gallaecimonas kandeliae TaxID=3029055 RepID=UPI002648B1AE|nr:hypothetical protein [Gallaecimonas kandeliae]WKE65906.1 hypothetical protein PVT67_01200 [Gallaecimonas kandeliae]